ncbi:MAG: NAD-dependent epimerase/dehydratase family protein [Chloroflexota bacterium]
MNLLIIGGTRFLGRALVDAARAAGHTVTLFNRGQSNPEVYADLEQIRGDRDGGLEEAFAGMNGRSWDAVIDTCGYVPRLVSDSARFFADKADHYTFISTISVYSDLTLVGMDENAPLGTMEDETVEEITGVTYGPLKVLCEKAAVDAMGAERVLSVRAGLLVGPHDQSDRFTYWPSRVARGGEVLAPDSPDRAAQFIDVRDLAAWSIRATEARLSGPYNVTGKTGTVTIGDVLSLSHQASGSDATFTWVSEPFLIENEVGAYVELPLWIPSSYTGFDSVDCSKALAAGLTYRSLDETVRDTLAWANTRPADYEWRGGLKPEREQELLAKWRDNNES